MSEEIDVSKFVVEKVKEQLEKRNWTQADLARNADVSMMNVSDVLTGKTTPSLAVVLKFADAFEVEIDYFFPPTT